MKIKVLVNFVHDGFKCFTGQILEGEVLDASPLLDDLDVLIYGKFIEIIEDELPGEDLPGSDSVEVIEEKPKKKSKGKK